jgi:hypothetical protein
MTSKLEMHKAMGVFHVYMGMLKMLRFLFLRKKQPKCSKFLIDWNNLEITGYFFTPHL